MAEYIKRTEALAIVDLHHGARQAYHKIKAIPAADVAPMVHGRWIKNEKASENHVEAIYVCSACQNWEAWGETEKTNYCPNCGARMDGE